MSNKSLYFSQRTYNYLEIKDRLFTFSWIKFDNFDQVLNNFTLLILQEHYCFLEKKLIGELNVFLAKTHPTGQMIELMNQFNVSPESFYQRLTNIL
jgi:hypothetical protein